MDIVLRLLILVTMAWFVILILAFGSQVRKSLLGEPPIPRPAFMLAKVSLTLPMLLLIYAALLQPPRLSVPRIFLCAASLAAGSLVFTAGFVSLGKSLRMGLPKEQTALVTSGIYRHSRNPIYVALYLYLGASLLYAFSWLNLCAVLAAVILHHRIILAEERFLAQHFEQYEAYRARVRRYI